MRQTNVRGSLSLRGFRKLRTGAIVATGVILLGLGFLAPTVSASEQDGVWVARTVEEVKADIQKEGDLFKYVIKWGDTLSVISEASNIPVDVLQEMNQASGKNLFLPHNELYFTEAETVSDTVTKHKIVIKESGASGEVRTYEVLLKKDQETKAVTFELTDVTEKVEKMTVNYSPVYQPVSAPVVERAEESGEEPASEAPVETSPEVKEETEAPVAPKAEEPTVTTPKAEEPATTPVPKVEEPVAPAPKAETPTPKVEEPTTPTPKEDATEGKVEAPKVEEPEASAEPKGTAPVVEEGTSGEQDQPAEETPAPSKPETPASTEEVAKEAEGTEPEAAKPAEPNAEAATESAEPKAEVPAEPKTEAPTTPENKEEQPGATEAPEPEVTEAEEPTAGTETTGASSTTSETNSGNPGTEVEESGQSTEPKDSVESTPEGTGSEEAGATGEASTGSTEAKATDPEVAPKEAEEPGTSEITEPATTAPAADSTSEDTNESKSEKPVAEETTVTEEQPATDGTASSSATSNSADSSSSTESSSTASEGELTATQPAVEAGTGSEVATPGATAEESSESGSAATESEETGASQPVASTSSSDDSTPKAKEQPSETASTSAPGEVANGTEGTEVSNVESESKEEKPQAGEPAVENQSLKKETEDSNKAAIDERKMQKEEEINNSSLSEDKKKAALKTVEQLTEDYHKKLENEKNPDKQAAVVDDYEEKLREIETPGVTYDSPDYNKPIESHAGGTTIDENSTVANSALTSSNPSSQPSSSEDSPQAQPAATSDSSTTGDSGFRSAGTYQPRVTRRRRSIEEPQNTVSIYYNFDGMKDIPGFFGDPGEKNTVTIPAGTSEAQAKELVKEKIQAKVQELNKRGYTVKEEIVFEQDTDVKNFNYVVTFTKQATGTTGFRIAPKVQVRAKKVAKRDLSNKTKQINIYYNLTALKDIAGALGELGGENVLTFSGETSKEELKRAVEEKTKAQIEKLKKQGFTVTSTTDLDQIVEGGDRYDYVVEFTKEAKTQPVGTTGFRMAPAVQPRASRNRRSLEQPAPQKVKVNVFYNFDKMKDIAGFLGDITETPLEVAAGLTNEQVKEAVKTQVDAMKDKLRERGYTFKEDYVYQANGKDYNYVVTFSKAAK